MTEAQKFVLSLYPSAECVQSRRKSKHWFVRDTDGTNISMGWRNNYHRPETTEREWELAAESLNYEILRKLEC